MARQESVRHLAWLAAITGLYFAAGKLGLSLAFLHPSASPVWPPSGLALAAMLLLGYRLWPAVYLGAFLVNVTTAGSVVTALGIATGNTLEALLGARFVNRFANGRKAFDLPEDSIKFVFFAALLSTTASATIGVTSLALNGYAPWRAYASIWLTWWLGDAVSDLIVTPFLVLWSENPRLRWERRVSLEAVLLLLVLLFFAWVIFAPPLDLGDYPIIYLCVLPLLWAVIRFGPREAATTILLLSGVAIWGTLRGSGPFVRVTPNESLFLLQAFIGVMALMAITVGAVISQRKNAQAELQKVQENLEKKVEERTKEIRGANTDLRKSEERFRAFLESSPDAMVIVDREGRIVQVSAQTEVMFGYKREELLGNRVEMLLPERFRQEHTGHREGFFASPRVRSMGEGLELFGLRKDGSLFPVDVSLSPLQTDREILVSAAIRDISRRKRREEEVRQLHSQLESAYQELETFSYSVSHDLRAPLRAMQGFASALQEDCADRLDPTGRDYTRRVVAAAERMDRIILDLLAYSRVSRSDLKLVPLDLSSIVSEALVQLETEARDCRAQIVVEDGLPQVVGNRAALLQVLSNLLTNAMKFVAPGTEPLVRVRGEDLGQHVRVWVEDNGIGIAPEDQERIFRVFERLFGIETYPGSGIGLAIVRKGMERMGGGAGVESRPGEGSRFWIDVIKRERVP